MTLSDIIKQVKCQSLQRYILYTRVVVNGTKHEARSDTQLFHIFIDIQKSVLQCWPAIPSLLNAPRLAKNITRQQKTVVRSTNLTFNATNVVLETTLISLHSTQINRDILIFYFSVFLEYHLLVIINNLVQTVIFSW